VRGVFSFDARSGALRCEPTGAHARHAADRVETLGLLSHRCDRPRRWFRLKSSP